MGERIYRIFLNRRINAIKFILPATSKPQPNLVMPRFLTILKRLASFVQNQSRIHAGCAPAGGTRRVSGLTSRLGERHHLGRGARGIQACEAWHMPSTLPIAQMVRYARAASRSNDSATT